MIGHEKAPGAPTLEASDVKTYEGVHEMNSTANAADRNVQAQTAQVIPFLFEAKQVRTLVVDDRPLFCAADVCAVLEYANSRQAIQKNCRTKGVSIRDTLTVGGVQPLTFIDEGNLYRLIIKSRKEEAQRFESWVCDEVLPAIRKHGRYEDTSDKLGTLLGETIGTYGVNILRSVIKGKVVSLPAATRHQATSKIWSQTHTAFGVRSAADIPASQLDAARNFIAAYALEGEWLAKEEVPYAYQLTDFQAAQVRHLLHSVAWVGYRWQQGIGKGVAGLNPALYGATVEHMQSMSRAASALDSELKDMLAEVERRQQLGGVRPQQALARGIAA